MTRWYVKDLSKLIGVSVQTLHHYDRIDLLKPSGRLVNGYRVYSETDLLHLQQIIGLKSLGFGLSQIKSLLTDKVGPLEHLIVQSELLEQKANTLLEASKVLKSIIAEANGDESISLKNIMQSIEVYHMLNKLEGSWVKEIFTAEELKQYATFNAQLDTQPTSEQKALFEKQWSELIEEINQHLREDPTSSVGVQLGGRGLAIINGLYGKQFAHLRTKVWERGYGEGKGLAEAGLTPETVTWFDKALDAYLRERIYAILDQVGKLPEAKVQKLWFEILDDMYGNDEARKNEIYNVVLEDEFANRLSKEAKQWLRNLSR